MTLTRAKFESLTADLTERCRGPFLAALKDANLTPQQIDEVVLVGGSTRMPVIQQLVKNLLAERKPTRESIRTRWSPSGPPSRPEC